MQKTSKKNQKATSAKKNKGISRLYFATINSFSGFKFAFEESAFRQELLLSIFFLPIAFILPTMLVEKLLMVGSILILLIVELLNSSIEATIDRISYSHHDLSKKAKDIGSCAVLISLIFVFIVHISVIIKYI